MYIDNLQKYNLPYAEAIFELNYFRAFPEAFNTLAKHLFPGEYEPTLAHHFINLLHRKGPITQITQITRII